MNERPKQANKRGKSEGNRHDARKRKLKEIKTIHINFPRAKII